MEWTPLAIKIIAYSYDKNEVLNQIKSSFRAKSWSGLRADIMEQRLCLLSDLVKHFDTFIVDSARKEEIVFEQEIRSVRKWELEMKMKNDKNESFE